MCDSPVGRFLSDSVLHSLLPVEAEQVVYEPGTWFTVK